MPVRRFSRVLAAVVAGTAVASAGVLALDRPPDAVAPPSVGATAPAVRPAPPTDVIVRFAGAADGEERSASRRAAGVRLVRRLGPPGLELVQPAAGTSVEQAAARLERRPEVDYAEPDVARQALVVPDDRLFGYQWGLHNVGQAIGGTASTADADIDAPEAWDLTTGSAGVVVAIVDSGVDASHPDLAPNIWTNPGESGAGKEVNGVDDDSNGLVDDVRGWDFVERDATPADGNGHGTHVAGTVGASGNDDRGVAGVAWRVGLLPLRVLGADGSGRVSDVVAAYTLAKRMGIRVVNVSLGGPGESRAERDAIRAAGSTLFVVAAGNEGADNDVDPSYPCGYDADNVVCVAAVDRHGELAPFSNRGAASVDLAAPGVDILSTHIRNPYEFLSGTSMATPHVAGAAALAWSLRPDASVAAIRSALLETVRPHESLLGTTASGGTLDLRETLEAVAPPPAPASTDAPAPGPDEPARETGPAPPGGEPGAAPAPAPGGEPAAAPTPAPGAVADDVAPVVRIATARRPRLRTLLARGLTAAVSCSEACTLRLRLELVRSRSRRAVVVGRARGGTTEASTARLRARLGARSARRLRRARRPVLRLVLTATDPAGNTVTVRRSARPRR